MSSDYQTDILHIKVAMKHYLYRTFISAVEASNIKNRGVEKA
jgi:hypothetical protein